MKKPSDPTPVPPKEEVRKRPKLHPVYNRMGIPYGQLRPESPLDYWQQGRVVGNGPEPG